MNTPNILASRRAAVALALVLAGSLVTGSPAAAATPALGGSALSAAGLSAGGDWLPPCKPPYDEEWCKR